MNVTELVVAIKSIGNFENLTFENDIGAKFS